MGKPVRALVTRPREESENLVAELAARGVETLVEPLIAIHYHAPGAIDLAGAQAVLCTSANGVRALARGSGERGIPLFAVGDATAARARAEGFRRVESAGGDVGDLARLAAARLSPRNGPLLHIAGDLVAGDLLGLLHAQGFIAERRILYEARAVAALSPSAILGLRSGAVALALFFSPRTATIFVRLAGAAGIAESCAQVTSLSISPATDTVLAALPWYDRRTAWRPNQPALLDVLDRIVGEMRNKE